MEVHARGHGSNGSRHLPSAQKGAPANAPESVRVSNASAASVFDTPVGPLYARADAGALTVLSFVGRTARRIPNDGGDASSREVLGAVERQIGEYFSGGRRAFDVPLDLKGPPFHVQVWEALLSIPFGATATYGQVANSVGAPDAARAVGAANHANPIVIIVPCHRVIGANGRLVGYGGGLRRKRILLDLECGTPALDFAAHA
jgi:methylated-DNA-[protein]-cysteine S-methyltransferase